MIECLIDYIFVMYGGREFQQTICGIPTSINCAPLDTHFFFFSRAADFVHVSSHVKTKR